MGGFSGIVSDRSMIQFKMLNESKDQLCESKSTERSFDVRQ